MSFYYGMMVDGPIETVEPNEIVAKSSEQFKKLSKAVHLGKTKKVLKHFMEFAIYGRMVYNSKMCYPNTIEQWRDMEEAFEAYNNAITEIVAVTQAYMESIYGELIKPKAIAELAGSLSKRNDVDVEFEIKKIMPTPRRKTQDKRKM